MFRPNVPMTRAEVVVAVNKMLQRHCVVQLDGAHGFEDVKKSYWAFDDIMEASTTHPVRSEK